MRDLKIDLENDLGDSLFTLIAHTRYEQIIKILADLEPGTWIPGSKNGKRTADDNIKSLLILINRQDIEYVRELYAVAETQIEQFFENNKSYATLIFEAKELSNKDILKFLIGKHHIDKFYNSDDKQKLAAKLMMQKTFDEYMFLYDAIGYQTFRDLLAEESKKTTQLAWLLNSDQVEIYSNPILVDNLFKIYKHFGNNLAGEFHNLLKFMFSGRSGWTKLFVTSMQGNNLNFDDGFLALNCVKTKKEVLRILATDPNNMQILIDRGLEEFIPQHVRDLFIF